MTEPAESDVCVWLVISVDSSVLLVGHHGGSDGDSVHDDGCRAGSSLILGE
jgi:hypothetical protein